jgi:hypothetical protein
MVVHAILLLPIFIVKKGKLSIEKQGIFYLLLSYQLLKGNHSLIQETAGVYCTTVSQMLTSPLILVILLFQNYFSVAEEQTVWNISNVLDMLSSTYSFKMDTRRLSIDFSS